MPGNRLGQQLSEASWLSCLQNTPLASIVHQTIGQRLPISNPPMRASPVVLVQSKAKHLRSEQSGVGCPICLLTPVCSHPTSLPQGGCSPPTPASGSGVHLVCKVSHSISKGGLEKRLLRLQNCCVYSCNKTFLFGWFLKLDQGLWESVRKYQDQARSSEGRHRFWLLSCPLS